MESETQDERRALLADVEPVAVALAGLQVSALQGAITSRDSR